MDLRENLTNENEIFYSENENNVIDNNKSLFELDFNAFANAKEFTQQDISDEEVNFDDIESSETKSGEECDDIINKVQNKENLSPCAIIDMHESITQLP
ncbi:unnamed protein product [Rhizophagus irregularis]|nr:unnamed protein product [Rhizophagus irregularis]